MTLLRADARRLPLRDASVDAVVTDPPYELGFMGKGWDRAGVAHDPATWAEALRVARSGAHLVAFGGTRTFHRLAVAVEDAGWELRDVLCWLHGQGFPKSLNLPGGLGTALKPGWEPVLLARKPLIGTVAENVLRHGTGGINVDGCRLPITGPAGYWPADVDGASQGVPGYGGGFTTGGSRNDLGRWPANVCLDEEAAAALDEQTGVLQSGANPERRHSPKTRTTFGAFDGQRECVARRGADDVGGASRFYYVAKATRTEREAGCDRLPGRSGAAAVDREEGSAGTRSPRAGAGRTASAVRNHHPTVKPVELMRWLVRLVTPPGGLVLDQFCGSGTTGCAALLEGRRFVGCDLEAEYLAIARARVAYWSADGHQPGLSL